MLKRKRLLPTGEGSDRPQSPTDSSSSKDGTHDQKKSRREYTRFFGGLKKFEEGLRQDIGSSSDAASAAIDKKYNLGLVGDGPVTLMTLSEIVREATGPLSIAIIGKQPKENFGLGAISDTKLEGAFLNVLAKKMSIDPRKGGESLFVNHLRKLGLHKDTWQEAQASADLEKLEEAGLNTKERWEGTKNWIKKFNPDTSIDNQYVPRILLHGMIQEFREDIAEQAKIKDIKLQYISAEATNVPIGDDDKPLVHIKLPDGSTNQISVDVAAVTIGLPSRKIPGGDNINITDVHHPDHDSVLHPESPGKKDSPIVVGSGLTSVDAVLALVKNGFFEKRGKEVPIISPSGEFPYPHEGLSSGEYDGSFLQDKAVPNRLKSQRKAKDFSDAIILSALHAIGAKYSKIGDNMKFGFPAHAQDFPRYDVGITGLIQEGNKILEAADTTERNALASVFSRVGERAGDRPRYSWQSVMDHFRPQIEDKWKSFSEKERNNWNRHYAGVWGRFRNRAPEMVHKELNALVEQEKITPRKEKVNVITQENNTVHIETDKNIITGNEVINGIGWGSPRDIPLVSAMRDNGTAHISETGGVKSLVESIVIAGQLVGNRKALSTTGFAELRRDAPKSAWEILEKLGKREASTTEVKGKSSRKRKREDGSKDSDVRSKKKVRLVEQALVGKTGGGSGIVSLNRLFKTMLTIDGSRGYILGLDQWREPIPHPNNFQKEVRSLKSYNPELADQVKRRPQSKGGSWGNFSKEAKFWPAVHVGLLLPTLHKVLESYGDTNVQLPYKETKRFFSVLPYAIRHCQEYEELAAKYKYQEKGNDQIKQEWKERLDKCFEGVTKESPLSDILDKLHKFDENLHAKAETALKHHDDPKAENDHLVGRMVLVYLATKGVPWEKLGIDPRVENYLGPLHSAPENRQTKSLYDRLLDAHVEKIPKLAEIIKEDVPDLNHKDNTQVTLRQLARIYEWYARPMVVEMVKPDLVGAAQLSFSELSNLFKHLEQTKGLSYYKDAELPDIVEKFKQKQSPEKWGNFTLVLDIIESDSDDKKGKPRDGKAVRKVMRQVWDKSELLEAWGNADHYVPESRSNKRDFSLFKRDIGDILYSASILEERSEKGERANRLEACANKVKESGNDLQALGNVIKNYKDTINELVDDWKARYPDHERTRIAQFLQQTFALKPARPVPIPLDAISLGFEGSVYRPDGPRQSKRLKLADGQLDTSRKHVYDIAYREARDMRVLNVRLPEKPAQIPEVIYYTKEIESSTFSLEIKHDSGESVRIPVPGRGSYDPFGTTGSAHAGEVIGYGCSVHHSSLVFMLTELAALGADRDMLKGFKDQFMEINPDKHHRLRMADFQVEQVWMAFNEKKELSFTEYIEKNPEFRAQLAGEKDHEHMTQYLEHPDEEPLAVSATRARLAYGYPDLYPEDASSINPRDSWYVTDVNAKLSKGEEMRWETIQLAE